MNPPVVVRERELSRYKCRALDPVVLEKDPITLQELTRGRHYIITRS